MTVLVFLCFSCDVSSGFPKVFSLRKNTRKKGCFEVGPFETPVRSTGVLGHEKPRCTAKKQHWDSIFMALKGEFTWKVIVIRRIERLSIAIACYSCSIFLLKPTPFGSRKITKLSESFCNALFICMISWCFLRKIQWFVHQHLLFQQNILPSYVLRYTAHPKSSKIRAMSGGCTRPRLGFPWEAIWSTACWLRRWWPGVLSSDCPEDLAGSGPAAGLVSDLGRL